MKKLGKKKFVGVFHNWIIVNNFLKKKDIKLSHMEIFVSIIAIELVEKKKKPMIMRIEIG